MRYLLDKVVVRHVLEGFVALKQTQELSSEQRLSITFYQRNLSQKHDLLIVPATANILQQLRRSTPWQALIDHFFAQSNTVAATRYYSRWSRRLREMGFTREDASVVALGTFSTLKDREILGANAVVTFDMAMINNW